MNSDRTDAWEAAMRWFFIVILSSAVCTGSGCAYCENGLCSPGAPEAILEPAHEGNWDFIDPKPQRGEECYVKVERDSLDAKAYRFTLIPLAAGAKQADAPSAVRAYLTKVGDALVLDQIEPPSESAARRKSPRHFIWKLEIKEREMGVRSLSEKFIKEHPTLLPHSAERSLLGLLESIRVTATTRELRSFVRTQARNDSAWTEPFRLRRR